VGVKNDIAAHIGNLKMTLASMTEKGRYLRKKVQIWWVKNDTAAAHIGNLKMTLASMTEKEHICVKNCRFGGRQK
jgi:hypothetical protein